MTQFGVRSSLSSPAARRMVEAGILFSKPIAPPPAPKARSVDSSPKARLRRRKLIERADLMRDTATMNGTAPVSAVTIMREVCSQHRISLMDIRSHRRSRGLVVARWEAIWRVHKETTLSAAAIGRLFKLDHTTVLHAIRRYADAQSAPRPDKRTVAREVAALFYGQRMDTKAIAELRGYTEADVYNALALARDIHRRSQGTLANDIFGGPASGA